MSPIAQLSGLTQGYGRRTVVTDLDLDVRPGVLGLLGPAGAGKTTLLRTLATAVPPRAGTVTVCGTRVRSERSARAARRDIGHLPQDLGYPPSFSVYDYVRYCVWLRGVPRGRAHAATLRAIESVGLTAHLRDALRSLPPGTLRRAGIAAAVAGSPRLLLLDEPTAGLDPEHRRDVRALIRSFADAAVVVSTRRVEDVAAVCDEVIVLAGGRPLFRGPPADLAAAAGGDLERGYRAVLGTAR